MARALLTGVVHRAEDVGWYYASKTSTLGSGGLI